MLWRLCSVLEGVLEVSGTLTTVTYVQMLALARPKKAQTAHTPTAHTGTKSSLCYPSAASSATS